MRVYLKRNTQVGVDVWLASYDARLGHLHPILDGKLLIPASS